MLLPAELVPATQMPAYAWLDRARAEQVVARGGGDRDAADLARAQALDPDLGARLRARARLHAFLRTHDLLPTTRLEVKVVRIDPAPIFALTYDRLTPDGRWMRVRGRVVGRPHISRHGPLVVVGRTGVRVEPGLQHLLTRHFATPLLALREQLGVALEVRVERLSRTWVGPFWTPGAPLPEGAPEGIERGLVLHLSSEVVADDVHQSRHRDPWLAPPAHERVPRGQGVYRERRFAATSNVVGRLEAWSAARGCEVPVALLRPPGR